MSTQLGNWFNEKLTVGLNDAAKPQDNRLIADGTDYRAEYFQETLFPYSKIGLTKDEDGVLEVLKGTTAGDAWKAYSDLRDAELLDAVLGGVGVGLDIQEAVTDPTGYAGSQIAGWMLQHIEPYRKVLDGLAGNPDMVKAYADSWALISTELSAVGSTWQGAVVTDTASWAGAAADAYRDRAGQLTDHIGAAGGIAAGMSETISTMQKIVDGVRSLVAEILASLLGALIVYTAELALTLGAAGPVIAAQALMRIGRDGLKITALLAELGRSFTDLLPYVKNIGNVIIQLLAPKEQEATA